uniref:Reverse transcriptase Ty1/copia-type domain-containing protein n=1 Tax=Opuntia streptacantha TaxID=393608 RepID=A0A7C9DR86_OPUST
MSHPTDAHLNEVYHLLRYLRATPYHGVLFPKNSDFQLTAFCDSDWESYSNSRKYVTSYVILLGQSPISWKSKRQGVVSHSIAEGEHRAMAATYCEFTWLLALLRDLSVQSLSPMHRFCDNQAALHIVRNPVFHEGTKHIEVDCHYVRDKFKIGQVQPCYVSSENQ